MEGGRIAKKVNARVAGRVVDFRIRDSRKGYDARVIRIATGVPGGRRDRDRGG